MKGNFIIWSHVFFIGIDLPPQCTPPKEDKDLMTLSALVTPPETNIAPENKPP